MLSVVEKILFIFTDLFHISHVSVLRFGGLYSLRKVFTSESTKSFRKNFVIQTSSQENAVCEDGTDRDPCVEAGYRARKFATTQCSILRVSHIIWG